MRPSAPPAAVMAFLGLRMDDDDGGCEVCGSSTGGLSEEEEEEEGTVPNSAAFVNAACGRLCS